MKVGMNTGKGIGLMRYRSFRRHIVIEVHSAIARPEQVIGARDILESADSASVVSQTIMKLGLASG